MRRGSSVSELAVEHPAVVEHHAQVRLRPALGHEPLVHLALARRIEIGVLVRAEPGLPGPPDHVLERAVGLDHGKAVLHHRTDRVGEPRPEPVAHHQVHRDAPADGNGGKGDGERGEQHRGRAEAEPGREHPGCPVTRRRFEGGLPETRLPRVGRRLELAVGDAGGQPLEIAHRRLVRTASARTVLPAGLLHRLHRRHRPGPFIAMVEVVVQHGQAERVQRDMADHRHDMRGVALVRDRGHPQRPFVLVVEVPGLVRGGDGGRDLTRVAIARVHDLERDRAGGMHRLPGLPAGAEAQPGAQRLVAAHDEAQPVRYVRHALAGRQCPGATHGQGAALGLHDRPDLLLAPAELCDA